jgi:hypothetical protein
MEAGDADVEHTVDVVAHHRRAHGGFLGDREVRGPCRHDRDCSLPVFGICRRTGDRTSHGRKNCVGDSTADSGICGCVRPRDQERVARRDDTFGDGGDLVRGLSRAENHFRETLPEAAMVIDPREAKVFERRLAQILKDAVVRRLRRIVSGLDLAQEGKEFLTGHLAKARGSKCLRRVDFQLCRAIESPIVRRDGFIFL